MKPMDNIGVYNTALNQTRNKRATFFISALLPALVKAILPKQGPTIPSAQLR